MNRGEHRASRDLYARCPTHPLIRAMRRRARLPMLARTAAHCGLRVGEAELLTPRQVAPSHGRYREDQPLRIPTRNIKILQKRSDDGARPLKTAIREAISVFSPRREGSGSPKSGGCINRPRCVKRGDFVPKSLFCPQNRTKIAIWGTLRHFSPLSPSIPILLGGLVCF